MGWEGPGHPGRRPRHLLPLAVGLLLLCGPGKWGWAGSARGEGQRGQGPQAPQAPTGTQEAGRGCVFPTARQIHKTTVVMNEIPAGIGVEMAGL